MQNFTDYRMEINCSFQKLVGDTAPKIGEVELQKKVPLYSLCAHVKRISRQSISFQDGHQSSLYLQIFRT